MQTVLRDRVRKEHLGFVFRMRVFDYRWISADIKALVCYLIYSLLLCFFYFSVVFTIRKVL